MNTCRVCGKSRDQFIRIADVNGRLIINSDGDSTGSDTFVCPEPKCLTSLKENRILEQDFNRTVPSRFFQSLTKLISKDEDAGSRLLGLGVRSRKVILGFTAIELAIVKRKISALILDDSAKETLKRRIITMSEKNDIPLITYQKKLAFEKVVGKSNCKCAGVIDRDFSQNLITQFMD